MATQLHKIIQDKFRNSRYENVKEFHTSTRCPLSQFTCTRIILQNSEPSLESAMVMLYLLGTPPDEMIQICKDHGDNVFWRMMVGSKVSAEEMIIVEALRKDPAKAQIVRSLLAL